MKSSVSGLLASAVWLASALAALAQAQTSAPEPEPAVQTSPAVMAPAEAAPAGVAAPAAAVPAAPNKGGASSPGKAPARASGTASGPGMRPEDRIELDTTQISGNRELPKVMYVVPWRRADLGDLGGRPQKSLLDEALTPVDRDVFRRENRYYAALESGGAATKPPAPESKDEK